ncbi:unnamed protein product [Ectocarpus sp. 6 AP-2014]
MLRFNTARFTKKHEDIVHSSSSSSSSSQNGALAASEPDFSIKRRGVAAPHANHDKLLHTLRSTVHNDRPLKNVECSLHNQRKPTDNPSTRHLASSPRPAGVFLLLFSPATCRATFFSRPLHDRSVRSTLS